MENTVPSGARPAPAQIVIREFPDIGKYKVRLVQKSSRDPSLILDVREYANSPTYQGFTRRGVRLSLEGEGQKLKAVLDQLAAELGWK